jgi:MFS family permease
MLLGGSAWISGCLLFAAALWVATPLVIPIVFAVSFVFAVAGLLYVPASRALAAELAPPESRGRYVASFEFSYGIAAACCPALFGLTYDFAPVAPWLLMSLLLLGAMFVLRGAEGGIAVERNRPVTSIQ